MRSANEKGAAMATASTEVVGRREGRGWVAFAATIIIVAGVMNILNGLWALDHDNTRVDSLLFSSKLTGWGWFYLVVGIVLVVIGVSIFRRAPWATQAGVIAAGIGMFLNFLWIFAFPIPSLALIGLYTLVLYGLMNYGAGADRYSLD